MKALIYPSPKQISLEEALKPKIKSSEALIRVKYAGICGSDIHVLKGLHPTAEYPVIPGHEFVGELVEIDDPMRKDLSIGDLVVAQPYYSCGVCEPCITGNDNVCRELKVLGVHTDGCFAEFVKVPSKKVFLVPHEIDEMLASLAEPIAVAVHDVRKSSLKVGDKILVIGGGPIGIMIAIIARHSGASKVVISEVNEYRLNFAEKMGFEIHNPLDLEMADKLEKFTEGKGFDVVFEASGSKSGVKAMINQAKINGTVIVVGMAGEHYPVDLVSVFAKQLTIKGVRVHSQENFAAVFDILRNKKIQDEFKELISQVFDFSNVQEAYDYISTETNFFKVILKM